MQPSVEPMSMGSPSSPHSPGVHNQPFLPAYLMGDTSGIGASPTARLWSHGTPGGSPPNKMNLNRSSAAWGASPANVSAVSTSFVGGCTRPRDMMGIGRTKEKTGAPPVNGLLESFSMPQSCHQSFTTDDINTSRQFANSFVGTPGGAGYTAPVYPSCNDATYSNQSFLLNQSRTTPPSPAQIDPFYTQGNAICADDAMDETWVTVFGFPPSAASFILQEFSQYGSILKHVMSPEGNWVHIHYQSKLQARKALSKNGKVFGGSIMVGVNLCIDKSVQGADKENDVSALRNTSVLSTSQADGTTRNKPSSLRPLTAAYKAVASQNEVRRRNAPQRSNSIVGKAMEYMFGW